MSLSSDAYVLLRDGAGWYIDSTGEHYARVQACWRPDDVVSFNGRHWRRAGRFIRMDRAVRIV